MKIAFCIDGLNKGGAERVITRLANTFARTDNVAIITTSTTKSEYNIEKNVELYSLDNDNVNKINKLKRVVHMYKLMKRIKPDVVVSFLPPQSFRVLLIKYILKLKVIVSVRNDPAREFKSFKYKIAKKLLYHKADGFVFQTEEARQCFSKSIQERAIVIPNPIDDRFLIPRYEGGREKEIVAVGRLEPQKNFELLIDAYKELVSFNNEYKLLIYGEGNLKDKLENKIKELNLEDKVILKGKVDDIDKKIYKSSIFVLSSTHEGMPNALMEAMAIGLPCISTDCPCGGPKYLIENKKDGILIENENKKELVEALKELIVNSDLQNKISIAANNKMKKFSTLKIVEQWRTYMDTVLNKK